MVAAPFSNPLRDVVAETIAVEPTSIPRTVSSPVEPSEICAFWLPSRSEKVQLKIRLKLVICTVKPSIVGVVEPKVGINEDPEVSKMVCVALVNPVEPYVMVYADPGVPNTPRLVKVTMPEDADCTVVPMRRPPTDTVAVTDAVELVTTFPLLS